MSQSNADIVGLKSAARSLDLADHRVDAKPLPRMELLALIAEQSPADRNKVNERLTKSGYEMQEKGTVTATGVTPHAYQPILMPPLPVMPIVKSVRPVAHPIKKAKPLVCPK